MWGPLDGTLRFEVTNMFMDGDLANCELGGDFIHRRREAAFATILLQKLHDR